MMAHYVAFGVFFFQAEDGIRDLTVTGVQTCALPIYLLATVAVSGRGSRTELLSHVHGMSRLRAAALADALVERRLLLEEQGVYRCAHQIGRASCRERG